MSSRIRLARNLAGIPFPNAATREQRLEVMTLARARLLDSSQAPGPGMRWIDLSDARTIDRLALVERHLVSKQMVKGVEPRAVAVAEPGERLSVMVNEEDHLRIQAMRSGFALDETWRFIDAVDDRLEARLDFAYAPKLGYLTACPTNVGAGIRVSVMLHLPGLKLTGEIEKVRRAASKMNLAVRGFYGEGSEAVGDFFQLSNQTTLGRSEREIIDDLEGQIVPQVIEYERQAREAMLRKRRMTLEDRVHRAAATLRSARLLSADESLQLLSLTRLGILQGLVEGVDLRVVHRLVLLCQPAHLQQAAGREIDQGERRILRAELVRAALAC
ncbi:MAG: protein arginine kinase [Phycisphaerales bacterium]|nr:protein arginine kinase [Phycisphaerales bacterium]